MADAVAIARLLFAGADQAHVQQRERTAGVVDGRAARHDEPFVLVEPDGLGVLLVHVERAHARMLHGMRQQRAPDTAPTRLRRDEQHLQLAVLRPREPARRTAVVRHRQPLDARDARLRLGAQPHDIVLGEEVVRGAHRALPHVHQCGHQLGRALARRFDMHARSFPSPLTIPFYATRAQRRHPPPSSMRRKSRSRGKNEAVW